MSLADKIEEFKRPASNAPAGRSSNSSQDGNPEPKGFFNERARLQTYFSVLCTLMAVLAGAIILLACIIKYDLPLDVMLWLLPAAALVFLLSAFVARYLAEPLTILVAQVKNYRPGEKLNFVAEGQLAEADDLAAAFNTLGQSLNTAQGDLSLKDSRQENLISDIAHELRTPLTAIRGNAEILLDPDLPPEMHERFVNTIINESARLSRLTTDLLSLEHMESTTKQLRIARLNLRDIAQDVVRNFDPLLRDKNAQVEIVGEAPDILGNRDKLTQVISNLVDNATHFIEDGGKITIEFTEHNGNAVMAVKDNGSGFGDTDPKLLFDRFYRTDFSRSRNKGGSGLGLAIVKSIVESHDGTVEALNLPEGGACFIIALPAIE